jgi:ribosomal protein S21
MELRRIKSNKFFEKPETIQRRLDAERRKREAAKRRKQNRARKPKS